MKLLALVAIASCSHRDGVRRDEAPPPPEPRARDAGVPLPPRPPGLRLPPGTTPLGYDVRLELDPAIETFAGRVAIQIRLDAPADHVWLHAVELEVGAARFRAGTHAGALALVAEGADMRAFGFGQTLPAGEVTLELDYTGHIARDDEGLFRQRFDNAWFLYSQAESMFARRFVPCFDEPRWKTPWRTTIVAPKQLVALANAPVASTRDLADGRRETVFAATPAMPPHLFAIAVGPFTLVDAGRVGRAGVPVRVAVAPADARRATAVAQWAPRLVAALERYLDAPLPLAKLDLVAVPQFFGAMENPGLITFEVSALVGDPGDPVYLRRFVRFLAHELAHQWFGNAVTPAWWDDLWLAEAFATWFDDKLSAELGQLDDGPLRTQLSRARALEADRARDAKPLRRAITTSDEAEDAFDAISYEKGAAVIEMFERFAGEAKFQAAVRDYLRAAAATGSATAADFLAALGRATTPALARAFAGYLDRVGTPVVEVTLACGDAPTVTAEPRDGAIVPVCVRYERGARGSAVACGVAAGPTRIALPGAASCPSVIGNADGRGYYHVRGPASALAPTAAERLAAGQDRAAEVARGELAAPAALAEIRALAATRDPYAALAALAIATEVDRLVDASTVAAWTGWLASRFAAQMTRAAMFEPRTPLDRALRDALVEVVPGARFDRATVQAATELVERLLGPPAKRAAGGPPAKRAAGGPPAKRAAGGPNARLRAVDLGIALAIAAPRGGRALFDRIVAAAATADDPARRDLLLDALGAFPAELAPRAVDLVLDPRFTARRAWPAVAAMLARTPTRLAAWRALRGRLPQLLAHLGAAEATHLVDATSKQCEPAVRAEIAAAFEPRVDEIADGRAVLGRALAAIDACIARRGALGALAAALR